jgi:WD40 repeat protein
MVGAEGFLLSASRDATARVWREATPEAQSERVLRGHGGAVLCLALVGQHLYTGSDDRVVKRQVLLSRPTT